MRPNMVQDRHDGVRYHRRYLKPTPFVLAVFTAVAFSAGIAIVHTGVGTLFGLIIIFVFLTVFYLDGPAKSVTVRDGTLKVRNSIHRYVIPPARVLAIDYVERFGVRVRVEGDDTIWVGAFSRSQLQFRRLSTSELETNAKGLTDALFDTPAPADDRPVKKGYRWGNVLLAVACAIAMFALNGVVNKS